MACSFSWKVRSLSVLARQSRRGIPLVAPGYARAEVGHRIVAESLLARCAQRVESISATTIFLPDPVGLRQDAAVKINHHAAARQEKGG